MLYSIQALRAVAAIAVVILHHNDYYRAYHVQTGAPTPWFFNQYGLAGFGEFGVHLFFVISGFIIASQRFETGGAGAVEFAIKRVSRIVPLYWIATFVWVAAMGLPLQDIWPDLLRSLAFIPPTQGENPTLAVGWTLNFEMFFYLLFGTLIVLLGQTQRLLLFVLVFVVAVRSLSGEAVMGTLGAPIVLEFGAGIVIAQVYRKPLIQQYASTCFAAGCVVLLSTAFWFQVGGGLALRNLLAWGPASAAIVLAAASMEAQGSRLFQLRSLRLLGDASYSIYLTHTLIYPGYYNLGPVLFYHTKFMRSISPDTGVIVLSVISVAIGVLVHLTVEKPLNRYVRHGLSRLARLPRNQAASRAGAGSEAPFLGPS